MASIRIAISGASGRMGQALAGLIAVADDLELVGGIDRVPAAGAEAEAMGFPRIHRPAEAAAMVAGVHVIIDFSAPEQLAQVLDVLEGSGPAALVTGTTGLTPDLERRLAGLAGVRPVLYEANFSLGVQLLVSLVGTAAAALDAANYDVEIVEAHHRAKVDAPSGTALALAAAVANAREVALELARRDGRSGLTGARPAGEIGIHALRGGSVVGDHRVMFLGDRERIELAHIATDRAVFAEGALVAARWVHARPPGRYSLQQVLGIG